MNKKLKLIKALNRNSEIMKSGIYMLNGRFIHKLGSDLPNHLIKSRGTRVRNIPVYCVLGNKKGFDVILDASEGGYLFLDTEKNKTLRTKEHSVFSDEYCDMRNEFSKVIKTPNYEILNNKEWQAEDLLYGKIVKNLSKKRKKKITEELVNKLLKLTSNCSYGYSTGYFDMYMEKIEPECRELILTSGIDINTLRLIIDASTLVPSHGDLELQNVIIYNDYIYVIDWDPDNLTLRPFWFDTISLYGARNASCLNKKLIENIEYICRNKFKKEYYSLKKGKDHFKVAGGYYLIAWYICFMSDKEKLNEKYITRLQSAIRISKEVGV